MSKMTLDKWEKTSVDKKLDASGIHGKEGSAKDKRLDEQDVKEHNVLHRTRSTKGDGK